MVYYIRVPLIHVLYYLKRERCFMKKVVKFGGSSLASAEQFVKVGNIIRADKNRQYVVPSAPGQTFSGRYKSYRFIIFLLRIS